MDNNYINLNNPILIILIIIISIPIINQIINLIFKKKNNINFEQELQNFENILIKIEHKYYKEKINKKKNEIIKLEEKYKLKIKINNNKININLLEEIIKKL